MIPETAPFSVEQRAWLNGFFAGMLSLDAQVTPLKGELPGAAAKALAGGEADDGAPWHDAAMPIDERMQLAEGRPLPRKLFAAMAQQDCGQCGYLCETYSAAIAGGAETKLNLCVPGGKETSRMLKRLLEEMPAPSAPTSRRQLQRQRSPPMARTSAGRSRDAPVEAVFRSAARLEWTGLGEGHAPRRARHLGLRHRLRAGRQLRPLPQQRSGPCRCRARRHARAAGFPRRRQELPPGADRGLRALARPRHAVRADRRPGRRRAAPQGQAAGQGRRSRWRCGELRRAGGAGDVRADPPRPGSVPRVPGAAAAAALFDRLLAAGDAGRDAPDRRCRALCGRRAHPAGRRLDVPCRPACAGGARQGLRAGRARLRPARRSGDADHHGRARAPAWRRSAPSSGTGAR